MRRRARRLRPDELVAVARGRHARTGRRRPVQVGQHVERGRIGLEQPRAAAAGRHQRHHGPRQVRVGGQAVADVGAQPVERVAHRAGIGAVLDQLAEGGGSHHSVHVVSIVPIGRRGWGAARQAPNPTRGLGRTPNPPRLDPASASRFRSARLGAARHASKSPRVGSGERPDPPRLAIPVGGARRRRPVPWPRGPPACRPVPDQHDGRRPRRQRRPGPRRPRAGRGRGAATSPCSPSWPSPATRPRTCCSSRASSPTTAGRSTGWPRATGALRRGRRLRRRRPRPLQRGRGVRRTARSRPCTTSATCRTTRCSTSSATSPRAPGASPLVEIAGVRVGVSICEDAWSPTGPIAAQAAGGAELVVNLNASPYYADRLAERERMLATRAADASCALVYVNQVGGQDELVFDGASMVFDADGEPRRPRRRSSSRRRWSATSRCCRCSASGCSTRGAGPSSRRCPVVDVSSAPRVDDPADACRATIAAAPATRAGGLRGARARHPRLRPQERLHRRGRSRCRAASTRRSWPSSPSTPSGPSASTACSCRRATRPTTRSTDAEKLAGELGIEHRVIPIEPAHAALPRDAGAQLRGPRARPHRGEPAVAHPRRGADGPVEQVPGWLVLTTGNKSEMAVGYSTLYGDTAGGFAVIKDVPKLLVYDLCRDRNARAGRELIPEVGAHQAAVGRAAARPARRPVAAALRGARPDPRGLRRGRPHRGRAGRHGLRPRRWSSASPAWSTRPSTSAGRPRPACGSRPRRSARTAGSRSPTATGADRRDRGPERGTVLRRGRGRAGCAAGGARGDAVARDPALRRPCRDPGRPVRLLRRAHHVAVAGAARVRPTATSTSSSGRTTRTPTTPGTGSSGARSPSRSG